MLRRPTPAWARAAIQRAAEDGKKALQIFQSRGGRVLSGALAFSAILSLVPLFVVILGMSARLFGEEEALSALRFHLAYWVGPSLSGDVVRWLVDAREHTSKPTVLSLLALVYGSTRVFSTLTRAFDLLWDAPAPVGSWTSRVRGAFFRKALAFATVIFSGIVMVVVMIAQSVLYLIRQNSPVDAPRLGALFEVGLSFLATVVLFFALFLVLPSRRVGALSTFVGALATALLFNVGSTVLGFYLRQKGAHSVFGAATSVMLLLVWTYYAAHAFFYGAALTKVIGDRASLPRGS